jgi:ATP-dependent helicase/nuclease subunit B
MRDTPLFNIEAHHPFLRSLALGLQQRFGSSLASVTILLPTRRAVRDLKSVLLEQSPASATLLPQIRTLGDIEDEDLKWLLALNGQDSPKFLSAIPPAIDTQKRQLILTHLIRSKDPHLAWQSCYDLAGELARWLDQTYTEDLDFSNLQNLVPDHLSKNWQHTLKFLDLLTEFWPKILEEQGEIDPADRRNRLMKLLAQLWQTHPPEHPIIAAGSTASIPATANLLEVILSLPQGFVVLPGLDANIDADQWDRIDETHPQFTMKAFLKRVKMKPDQVRNWDQTTALKSSEDRAQLARYLFYPAADIHAWPTQKTKELEISLQGIEIIEASTLHEEASYISLVLRHALEKETQTACLITPDRTLARLVASSLKRWNITADDSAGTKLLDTAQGQFFFALVRMFEKKFEPAQILHFLKHPFLEDQISSSSLLLFEKYFCRRENLMLDTSILRQNLENRNQADQEVLRPLIDWLDNKILNPYHRGHGQTRFEDHVSLFLQIAEACVGTTAKIWSGAIGEFLYRFFNTLYTQSHWIDSQSCLDSWQKMMVILGQQDIRLGVATHPRLRILGQIESRHADADITILAGLNEGSWPEGLSYDPWMSQKMRQDFGLPLHEKSIGLAAQDFLHGLMSPRVVLSRSLKQNGTNTIPSRWLERLRALCQSAQLQYPSEISEVNYYPFLNQSLRTGFIYSEPSVSVSKNYKPQRLSATTIEKFIANPYRFYTEKILKLSLEDELGCNEDLLDRGQFLHALFQDFIDATREKNQLDDTDLSDLKYRAHLLLDDFKSNESFWQFWSHQLDQICEHFFSEEQKLRAQGLKNKEVETSYSLDITTANHAVTLQAKLDRMDLDTLGQVHIIDYKTSGSFEKKQILNGEKSQLLIEALLLSEKDFKIADLYYWRLQPKKDKKSLESFLQNFKLDDVSFKNCIAQTKNNIHSLIETSYADNFIFSYRTPTQKQRFADDQKMIYIARAAEWSLDGPSETTDESDDQEAA